MEYKQGGTEQDAFTTLTYSTLHMLEMTVIGGTQKSYR
jgi:hypothetical protein